MNKREHSSLEIGDFYRKTRDLLKLKPALRNVGFSRKAGQSSLRKIISSVQIWGKREIQCLESLSAKGRREFLREKLKDNTFCVILADGLSSFWQIEEGARKRRLAFFYSELSAKTCRERVRSFFLSTSSGQMIISGGFLEIFGLGVLIVGDSGIGKSESSLELISRGCRFVSDDVVQVKRGANGRLLGKAPPLTRHFMEIRGLGIINIKEIFGRQSISNQAELNLVINLKKLRRGKDYDRLGLEFLEDYEILGIKIPQINIPVAPGRNMATLIEVACKAHILKEKGYHAPQDLVKKLSRALSLR